MGEITNGSTDGHTRPLHGECGPSCLLCFSASLSFRANRGPCRRLSRCFEALPSTLPVVIWLCARSNPSNGERFLNETLIARLVTALTQVVDDGEGAGLGVGERALEPLEALGVLTVHHADHLLQRHCSTRKRLAERQDIWSLEKAIYYSAILTCRPTTLLYYYHIPTSRHARLLLRGPPVQRVRHHLDLG